MPVSAVAQQVLQQGKQPRQQQKHKHTLHKQEKCDILKKKTKNWSLCFWDKSTNTFCNPASFVILRFSVGVKKNKNTVRQEETLTNYMRGGLILLDNDVTGSYWDVKHFQQS